MEAKPTLSFDVHLTSTPAQLHALLPSLPTPYDSVITGASLVVQESTTDGKSLSALASSELDSNSATAVVAALSDVDLDLALNAGGDKLLELRLIKGVLYARADVNGALALVGLNQSSLASVRAEIPSGSEYDFARAALKGDWISFNVASELRGFLSTAPSVSSSSSKSEDKQLIAALKSIYNSDITVTKDGSTSASSTKLAVSGNEQTLAKALVTAFAQLEESVGAGANVPVPNLSKVPSKTVTAFAGLSGDTLNALATNLSQFIPTTAASKNPLELEVGVTHPSVSITAPSSATAVSVPGFEKLFAGLGEAASGSSTTASSPSST